MIYKPEPGYMEDMPWYKRVSVRHISGRKFRVFVNGSAVKTFTSKEQAYKYAATLRKETK